MSKKKKSGSTPPRPWGEWCVGAYPEVRPEHINDEDWKTLVEWRENSRCYVNDIYQVNISEVKDSEGNAWEWLSIKRRDKKVIHDWRAFQRIKNELCGENREAIEIYPPEDQLVDEANQFHLWVLPEGRVSPIGFRYGRSVVDSAQAELVGAKQRPFS